MIKKISYLLFVFIGLFFLNLHVKADFNVTGLTSNLPSCSSSTYPTFLEESVWYSCVFDWALNYAIGVNNPSANPSINNNITIDDFPYVVGVSYISPSSSSHFDYDLLFFESEPEIVTRNGNKALKSNGGYFWYRRYWYNNNSRRAALYYIDPLSSSNIPVYYLLNNFSNNSQYDRIYSGFNVVFDNINTIPNFPISNYVILPFSFGNTIYNSNFLDDNLLWTRACLNSQNTFFSVLPNSVDITNNDVITNYVLFPYFLNNYNLNWLQYDTSTDTNIYENNYDLEGLSDYKLDSRTLMSELLTDNYYIQDFNTRYPSTFNGLYGWNLFLNRYEYTSDDKYNIQVFHFDNSYTESVFCHVVGGSTYCEDAHGNIHGGGGRELGSVVDTPERNICFYYPSDMILKVWNINDFNDIDDIINLNGTDYDIKTDSYENGYHYNINDNTYSGFIGYFKTMLQRLSVPILFINSKITLFFGRLPQDLQYMIIGILALGFMIGLIKFLTGGK